MRRWMKCWPNCNCPIARVRKSGPSIAASSPLCNQHHRSTPRMLRGFLRPRRPPKIPYGWGLLQSLGLSATIRLFDGDRDAFVEPEELLKRVNHVMMGVIERYRPLMDTAELRDSLGAPFAEILLRPGKDRVPGPFDGKISDKKQPLDFDNALSMVQLSLRPRVEPVWRYHSFQGFWTRSLERPGLPAGAGTFDADAVFMLAPDPAHTIDFFRPSDGGLLELKPAPAPNTDGGTDVVRNKKPTLPTIGQPSPGEGIDLTLTLVARTRRDFNHANLKPAVGLGVLKRTRTIVEDNTADPPKRTATDKDEVREESLDSWISHLGDVKGFDIVPIFLPDGSMSVDPSSGSGRRIPSNGAMPCSATSRCLPRLTHSRLCGGSCRRHCRR